MDRSATLEAVSGFLINIMAENKKGFMLYADQKELFEQLPNELAGELIKHIFKYVNDENPISDNLILNIAFTPIKLQLKRDLVKWEKRADRSRLNGSLGGRPKNLNKPKEPNGFKKNPDEPRKPDTVNVNVNVINKNIYKKFNHLVLLQSEFEKLNVNYSVKQITEILNDIENFTGNKKYKSLYLTALKWLKKNNNGAETPRHYSN